MAAGFEASHWGAPLTIALGAAVCLISVAIFALQLKDFRLSARELLDASALPRT
jgi:divalent metal cation (Fe/Co/Zn/Cd) transporter